MNKNIINSDLNTGGLYRAKVKYDGTTAKVFIPCLTNNVAYSDDAFIMNAIFSSEEMKKTALVGEATCWVTFENSNSKRPIIIGYFGDGLRSIGGSIKPVEPETETEIETPETEIETPETEVPETETPDLPSITINTSAINEYFESLVQDNSAKEHGSGTGTQCVELPNHYLEYAFGLTNYGGFGNGNTYYSGVCSRYPDNFEKIEYTGDVTLKVGDIISLEGSQVQYGHAAIVKFVDGSNITIFEQWKGSETVRISTFTLTNKGKRRIIGIARPK